jgi:valyl-tRNA synthetase
MEIEKVYEPGRFEPHWAQWWVESGIYRAEYQPGKPTFSLVIPPPNVTGSLHMGHMLEHSEIDVTVRWHRMRGEVTLWLPGYDHAGIATEMIVARQLRAQGIEYRRDLTREAFIERVWQWKAESGGTIKKQMIQIGASCDWSRERFTLDEGLSRAVREVFVSLYERGLIYRGEYMVNWCPSCNTAISDLESVHEEMAGSLWHIKYPVTGGSASGEPRFLTVATTRPETMLGDTAVAINPRDERYLDLHGKTVRLPLSDREIPIILDEMADPEFGTGVVKITPAHDPNDFEAGKRHNLPRIEVIGRDAKITQAGGSYAGMDRYDARQKIVKDLEALGLLERVEDYVVNPGKCQRCKSIVEPLVSKQWFVRTKPLAEKAIAAVDSKKIEIVPDVWIKTWNEWMHNIRDWCISRQLWWGHRIPVWYCDPCNEILIAREDPTACPKCGGKLYQDPDVLDTWFSSGLWPFSTLGWPDQTEDLKHFYPTTLLITGFDILFFWVARMAMLGIEFMNEVPFRQVYIHGLVRDAEKQKMSKTKGNVIDPLAVTQKQGTDAVRMALLMGAAPGTDIVFTDERVESARAFANKIWNASRFLLMNMDRCAVPQWMAEDVNAYVPKADAPIEDKWIFHRINECAKESNRAIAQFRYHEAAQSVWRFFWNEFCDWYVELKKLRFVENSGLNDDWRNLLAAFESALRLLHPMMPFVTEELWHRLGSLEGKSISLTAYPSWTEARNNPEVEKEITQLQDVITALRNLRADLGLDPKMPLEGIVDIDCSAHSQAIQKLAGVALTKGTPPKSGAVKSMSGFTVAINVPAAQLEVQRKRLEKERDQLIKNIANSDRQLNDEVFLGKAPQKVVDSIRAKKLEYESQLQKIQSSLGTDPAPDTHADPNTEPRT